MLKAQRDLVKVIRTLRPVLNYKGTRKDFDAESLASLVKSWYLLSEGMQSMRVNLVNPDRLSSFSYQLEWGGFVR